MPRGAGGQVALSRAVLVRALGEGLILEMWELKRGVVKSLPQVCGWSWWGQASPPPPALLPSALCLVLTLFGITTQACHSGFLQGQGGTTHVKEPILNNNTGSLKAFAE